MHGACNSACMMHNLFGNAEAAPPALHTHVVARVYACRNGSCSISEWRCGLGRLCDPLMAAATAQRALPAAG